MKIFAVLLCTFVVAFSATLEHLIEEEHHMENFEIKLLDNLDKYLGLQINMIKGVQKIQLLLGNVEKILEKGLTGNCDHTEDVGATLPEEEDENLTVSLDNDFDKTLLDYLGVYQELQIRLNKGIEKIQLALGNMQKILANEFFFELLTETESEKLTKPKAKDSAKQPKNGKRVFTSG